MAEQCLKDKDHGDFGSFAGGIVVAAFVTAILFALLWPRLDAPLVTRNDKGLVCKADRYYPQANCKAALAAFGPRLNTLKVKR